MQARMKTQTIGDSTEISLTVPSIEAKRIYDAIISILNVAKLSTQLINDEGEKLYTIDDVFPDGSPSMALQGLRTREGLSNKEFADGLGISELYLTSLENGEAPITQELAELIASKYNTSPSIFL
ncbi:MAG: helix-turn-helix transcriptional regulator [Desulfovibrio sp.]|nr:helix-turn-helix transcriptional regulator [Desulfovibrio sp.]